MCQCLALAISLTNKDLCSHLAPTKERISAIAWLSHLSGPIKSDRERVPFVP